MEIKLNSAHMGTIEEAAQKYNIDAEELESTYKNRQYENYYDDIFELAAELAEERD